VTWRVRQAGKFGKKMVKNEAALSVKRSAMGKTGVVTVVHKKKYYIESRRKETSCLT